MYVTDPTSGMHWPVRIFCVVLTVVHAVEAPLSGTHHQGPGLAANWNDHKMRLSAGGGIPAGRKSYRFHWASNARTVVVSLALGLAWTAIADTAIPSVHPVPIP